MPPPVSPASAMFRRQLHTRLDLLRQKSQKRVCTFNRELKWRDKLEQSFGSSLQGTLFLLRTGPVSCTVETSDHIIWRRHIDQLLHAGGSCDDSFQPTSLVPELGAHQDEPPPPDEPPKKPSRPDTVSDTSTPGLVKAGDITPPTPGRVQSSLRNNMTDMPTGCVYPRRNR